MEIYWLEINNSNSLFCKIKIMRHLHNVGYVRWKRSVTGRNSQQASGNEQYPLSHKAVTTKPSRKSKLPPSNTHRPLNSHSFPVCDTVSLPFSWCHHRFFICHSFTNLSRFFPKISFLKKKKQKQHISMLIQNTFLVWLTKIKQAFTVLGLWVGLYCSLC